MGVSACCLLLAAPGRAESVVLVKKGVAKAVIVVADDASSPIRKAAEELQYHLKRASGAALPIVTASSPEGEAGTSVRVLVGFGAGIDVETLLPEEYVIKTVDNALCIVGEQRSHEPKATAYGVYDFLDRALGVRWLWPGDVGTFVPKRSTIVVEPLDIRGRPALEKRHLRTQIRSSHTEQAVLPLLDETALRAIEAEAQEWLDRHRMGGRSSFGFGHAFGKWWDRYHEAHPDYFAVPPDGIKQPSPSANRVKLCVSNPAVTDQILEEWRAAGRPDNWNVCPNDSRGFCTCENCRALDGFPNQTRQEVWDSSEAVLTGRYMALWNGLLPRMRAENPNATLSSYAYSNYNEPIARARRSGPRSRRRPQLPLLRAMAAVARGRRQVVPPAELVARRRPGPHQSPTRHGGLLQVRLRTLHAGLRLRFAHGVLGHPGPVLLPHRPVIGATGHDR